MEHMVSILMILAGALLMVFSILGAKDLFVLVPFIPKRSQPSILRSLRLHRGLMLFFLAAYLVVAVAFFYNIVIVGELFVGVVFLFGALFVMIGNRMQTKMLQEVKNTLTGLLPICSSCKKIRDTDSDPRNPKSWSPVEQYISKKTDAHFTHSMCPDCLKKLYPDLYKDE